MDGKKIKGVQIGAVCTLPEYRNKGLSRILMNYVLEKYKDNVEIIFLFANGSVIDFYPKFGFKKYDEVLFVAESYLPVSKYMARKLNINNTDDYQLVVNLLNEREDLSKLWGAQNYAFITWWYILNFYKNHLYYIEEDDILFIMEYTDSKLNVYDIVFKKPVNINYIIPKVIEPGLLKSITYHFTPDVLNFQYDKTISNDDSPLFVLDNFDIKNGKFKFPFTAQT